MAITKVQARSGISLVIARLLNRILTDIDSLISNIDARQAETATITVGAEDTNTINVAVVLKDVNGTAVESLQGVSIFLSDDSGGIGLTSTAPSGAFAIGTDGAILGAHAAGKDAWVQTEADGTFDITITEAGAATWYLVVQLPNGKQIVSDEITFAA